MICQQCGTLYDGHDVTCCDIARLRAEIEALKTTIEFGANIAKELRSRLAEAEKERDEAAKFIGAIRERCVTLDPDMAKRKDEEKHKAFNIMRMIDRWSSDDDWRDEFVSTFLSIARAEKAEAALADAMKERDEVAEGGARMAVSLRRQLAEAQAGGEEWGVFKSGRLVAGFVDRAKALAWVARRDHVYTILSRTTSPWRDAEA